MAVPHVSFLLVLFISTLFKILSSYQTKDFFLTSTAYNRTSTYTRKKFKKKLLQYEDDCELVRYLSSAFTQKYKAPHELPIDFRQKLGRFLSLKDTVKTTAGLVQLGGDSFNI